MGGGWAWGGCDRLLHKGCSLSAKPFVSSSYLLTRCDVNNRPEPTRCGACVDAVIRRHVERADARSATQSEPTGWNGEVRSPPLGGARPLPLTAPSDGAGLARTAHPPSRNRPQGRGSPQGGAARHDPPHPASVFDAVTATAPSPPLSTFLRPFPSRPRLAALILSPSPPLSRRPTSRPIAPIPVDAHELGAEQQ